ncbi:MAG: hypothetical protein QOI27_910 [Gaiellaceae bacterium]|jgi:hypothetical protein|nr:hypothetical protein [Gaiellaceae bacterium]MDX6468804.1 hypothetical protein [Gaiellaceae bacterium]MDX6471489.1 hypothetical protein [Gaiellaceae bacterium]
MTSAWLGVVVAGIVGAVLGACGTIVAAYRWLERFG